MKESIRIVRQVANTLEGGPVMCKVPKVIKPAEGEIYSRTESARGEIGYHIMADGKKVPYRVKVKSPSFTHTSMLGEMGEGVLIADLVAAIGSLDIVLGEVDR